MGIIEGIIGIVAASASAMSVVATTAGAVSALSLVYGVVYGGYSVCKSLSSKRSTAGGSPTYNGTLQTQINNQLPLALIYGKNKLAGNIIWQQLAPDRTSIRKIIAFGEGEVSAITDIRLNDIPISSIPDAGCGVYVGLSQAQVDPIVTADDDYQRIQTVGSLKNVAYITVLTKFTADISANFNTTAVIFGRKVRVYSNASTYTVQYSSNPAWCLLDFLTAYNGCGIGLKEDGSRDDAAIKELIDISSFISAASFCDEIVDEKPRFSFNMIFDTQSSRRDIIEEFKKSCRGALVMKGKQLQFKIDRPAVACKTISANDIIAGTEQITTVPVEENFDRITVKYRSQNYDWAIVETCAERANYSTIPPIEHTVDILSVIDHQQATRLAWYYLNKVNLERTFGYFETDYRAFDLEIGDVIDLSDNIMKYKNKFVKITRLIDKNDGTFGVYWREYNPSLYTDTPGALAPTVTETNDQDMFLAPSKIEYFHVAQNKNLYIFNWLPVSGEGISYEIRQGSSWDESNLVCEGINNTNFNTLIRSTGLKSFFIKAKNTYGVYSEEPAAYLINISDIPTLNVILNKDLLEDPPEECSNCYLSRSGLKLNPNDTWQAAGACIWANKNYYAIDGKWGAKTIDAGYLKTDTYDLGNIINSFVSLDYESNEKQKYRNIRIYWQSSKDDSAWSDWKIFGEEQCMFRYYRFKIELINQDTPLIALYKSVFNIDVEDRDEYYANIEIQNANDGITIDFAEHEQSRIKHPFNITPSVVANVTGNASGFCIVTSKSSTSCTIKAFDTAQQAICSNIDVHVKGY